MSISNAALLLVLSFMLSACLTPVQNAVLPDKYDRIAAVDGYKSCVASATNHRFDETTNPDVIVRNSLSSCAQFKNNMLKAYPARWRENYIKDVDAELYQREIDWIRETRNNKNTFFR